MNNLRKSLAALALFAVVAISSVPAMAADGGPLPTLPTFIN